MTPAILVDRLTCRSLRLEDVPLLVFDEAHHCRKNHAYRQIMQMYDSLPRGAARPHIFGMTACPVNSKVRRAPPVCSRDLRKIWNRCASVRAQVSTVDKEAAMRQIHDAVRELEVNLSAKVVTVKGMDKVYEVRRPRPAVLVTEDACWVA